MTSTQVERWRGRLAVGSAIKRLNKCVRGEIELSTSSMKAIEVTLRKTIPDLASIDLTSGGEPVTFTWKPAEQITVIEQQTDSIVSNDSVSEDGDVGAIEPHTSAPEKQTDD